MFRVRNKDYYYLNHYSNHVRYDNSAYIVNKYEA